MNWTAFFFALPLAMTIAFMMEMLRSFAGTYSGMPWYAAFIKFWLRTVCYQIALSLLVAYAAGSGVSDAMRFAVDESSETVYIAPGVALYVAGALATLLFFGVADIIAVLCWASAIRHLPWGRMADAQDFAVKTVEATGRLVLRSAQERWHSFRLPF